MLRLLRLLRLVALLWFGKFNTQWEQHEEEFYSLQKVYNNCLHILQQLFIYIIRPLTHVAPASLHAHGFHACHKHRPLRGGEAFRVLARTQVWVFVQQANVSQCLALRVPARRSIIFAAIPKTLVIDAGVNCSRTSPSQGPRS